MKNVLFWFTDSEISVPSQLAPLRLGLWQSRNIMVEGKVGGSICNSQDGKRQNGAKNNVYSSIYIPNNPSIPKWPYFLLAGSAGNSSMD